MKRIYEKPEMEVVLIEARQQLMAGSIVTDTTSAEELPSGTLDSHELGGSFDYEF